MRLIFVIVALTLSVLRAEDWTVGGKTYKNVVVGKVDPDKVHISFDGGIGSIPLSELSPGMQKKFGYDPAAAKIATEAEQKRITELDKEQAAAEKIMLKKKAVQDAADSAAEEAKAEEARNAARSSQMGVRVIQVLPGGILCVRQTVSYSSPYSATRSNGFGKALPATAYMEDNGPIIFVECQADGMVDDQQASLHAYRDGSYSYTDTLGAVRTIEKWVACNAPPKPQKTSSINDDVLKSAP